MRVLTPLVQSYKALPKGKRTDLKVRLALNLVSGVLDGIKAAKVERRLSSLEQTREVEYEVDKIRRDVAQEHDRAIGAHQAVLERLREANRRRINDITKLRQSYLDQRKLIDRQGTRIQALEAELHLMVAESHAKSEATLSAANGAFDALGNFMTKVDGNFGRMDEFRRQILTYLVSPTLQDQIAAREWMREQLDKALAELREKY